MPGPSLGARLSAAALMAAVLAAWTPLTATAEEPLSVVYGPKALSTEGDPDYREIIYLKVPDTTKGRLYLRVFDADTGGAHDLVYGSTWTTRTRYALLGGAGAAQEPGPAAVGAGAKPTAASPMPLTAAGGALLLDRTIGDDPAFDDTWQTLGSVAPEQGQHVGGHYVFRLEVTGVAGRDANLFDVTLSLRDRRNMAPAGLELTDYAPTVRIPDAKRLSELVVAVPGDADRLLIHNFDAASGRVAFASAYRTVELAASGQDEWRSGEVVLLPEERNRPASIILAGGKENPNDVTVFVTDGGGRPLPIALPATAWRENGRPQAAAEVAPLADCAAFAFDASGSTDPDHDRLRYHWAFGDGTGSDQMTGVHRYPAPGSYKGSLLVEDDSGQVADGASRPFQVTVKRGPTAHAGAVATVAPREAVLFDATGSTPGDRPIIRYGWTFGDGSSADGPQVAHAFQQPGRYVVTLHVEDDRPGTCDADEDQRVVQVNAPPVAVAGVDRHLAVGESVTLDGRQSYDVDGTITAWSWDLGDGTTADGATVVHHYAQPGTYVATLAVRDGAGLANSAASTTVRMIVNDPPRADAGPDRRVALGELVRFDGTGSTDRDGTIVRYAWDFGDGASGQGAQVHYAYGRPGTYKVSLHVTDDSGTTTSGDTATARVVVNAPPIAHAGPDQLVTASVVQFDGSRSTDPDGAIAAFAWDFGDGTAGSGARPVHVYREAGLYRVRLTVTDDSGTVRNAATDSLQVRVNQAPIADAGRDQLGTPGEELVFSGAGSLDPDGDVIDYHWEFGDGGTADGVRVTHRFQRSGVYEVRLTVHDDTGQSDAVAFDQARVVINAPPVASAGSDVRAAPGDEVVLDAGGSFDRDGRIATWRWDFSDTPEPAMAAVVKRSYPMPGVYSARLTVTDDSGASNGVAQDAVTVRINHAPVANAGHDVRTASAMVALDGSASADADGDPLRYTWDFGDGSPPGLGVKVSHVFPEGGTYPVVLTVNDGSGLRNAEAKAAMTVVIDRPPVADAGGNRDVCGGDVVVFDGSRSHDPEGGVLRYHWDFGDGTTSDIVNPTKTYRRGAVYPVTLTVEDDSGFPENRHTDRILVKVAEAPLAAAGPSQQACAGSEVHFDGSASHDADGVVNRFTWNFGDGSGGGGDRPVHIYTRPGDYRVVLTIEGDQVGQCANTNSSEMSVKVVAAPIARIAAPAAIPVGAAATFDASGSDAGAARIVGWHWSFGDGAEANGRSVDHTYAKAGAYVATLTLATEGGAAACSTVTAQQAIVANAPPVAVAGGDRIVAVDQDVLFNAAASHDDDGGIVAYAWDFGDGGTASGLDTQHRFHKSGRYEVRLTVTDNTALANNHASDIAVVTVNEPPVPVIGAPAVACPGESVVLSGAESHDAHGRIATYAWSFGDGAAAQGREVTHSFKAPGLYELGLLVDDGSGLANAQAQIVRPLRVNRAPRAAPGPDRLVCPGEAVVFDGTNSVDWDGRVVGWHWAFGDGSTADGPHVTHAYTAPGEHEVRLTVNDDSGSSCAANSAMAQVVVDAPPVARSGGDRQGFVGGAHDEILFDGSGSIAADGRPLSFLWSFPDGTVLPGKKVRHAFTQAGAHPVRLTVSDGTGLACGSATDSLTADVRPHE